MKKEKFKMLMFLIMLVVFSMYEGITVNAAETQIGNSSSVSGGNAYTLEVNKEYYTTLNGRAGFVSFVTPKQEGYIRVECKNISVSRYCEFYMTSSIKDQYFNMGQYQGNSGWKEFKSEVNNNNNAKLATNTRYYIQCGADDDTVSGNVKLVVHFIPDLNPNSKNNAQEISLNQDYTCSMDSEDAKDEDYFKFTADSTGLYRFTLTNVTCGGSLDYEIRKWSSDELVKDLEGHDTDGYMYSSHTATRDMNLEKGQIYYIKIFGASVGNYTFRMSNQRVTGISIPASKSMKPDTYYSLQPLVIPDSAFNKSVSYSSSNESVAVVNNEGKIYARATGKAIITVKANDGSNISATCTVRVSPGAPSGLYYSKFTSGSISLTWNAVEKASGYDIYKKNGKKWKKIGTAKKCSYTVKKLKSSTGYQFKIKAYKTIDKKKYTSSYSNTLSVATCPKQTYITGFTKLSKQKNSYSVTYRAKIHWKKVSGASYYNVYYRMPGSTYKTRLGSFYGTSATFSRSYFKNSSANKKYIFYVEPVKSYKNNHYSGKISKKKSYRMH